jgi:lipopolysaccharide transport system ATP-binding protein
VLGLSKREIDGKIDEIVDFAEIGEFIDSPVQSYSSGMQVRLGFAVATALNPDVLLLDEVLAVGDARFRAKCYEKLSVFLEKSAVVFVSHNMEQIGQICSSVIVMKSGMAFLGCDVGEAINLYDKINSGNVGIIDKHEHVSKGVELIDKNHTEHVDYGGVFTFMCTIMSSKKINNTDVKIDIFNSLGQSVAVSCTKFFNQSIAIDIGVFKYCFSLGPIHLREGYYTASVVLLNSVTNEHIYWGSRTLGFIVRGPRLGAGNFIVPMQVSIADLSG